MRVDMRVASADLRQLALEGRIAKTGPVIGQSAHPHLVFAHQFGWDEILLFLVPVVLALLAVRWFEKRSSGEDADDARDDAGEDGTPSD